MKKIIAFLVLMAAVTSQADYLFWQVSNSAIGDDSSNLKNLGITTETMSNYRATLKYGTYSSGTTLSTGTLGGDGSLSDSYSVNLSSISGGASSYSYYIEISNYSDNTVAAVSELMSYKSLAENSYIGDIMTPAALVPWTGGTYSAPEPSSALLMLLGAALLGLKRKVA